MPEFTAGQKLTAAELNSHVDQINNVSRNFGYSRTLDSPGAGQIRIAFLQGDNLTVCDASDPAKFNFSGRQEALQLAAALNLDIAAADDFEMDTYGSNTTTALYIYAINDSGTLRFGVGRRPDYVLTDANFVTTGSATTRDHVLCTAAPGSNSTCFVVGFFQVTYDVTANDWGALVGNLAVRPSPTPHPQGVCKAWVRFVGGTGTINDSFNVVAASNDATGKNTITFDSDMKSSVYVAAIAVVLQDGVDEKKGGTDTFAAGSLSLQTTDTSDTLANAGKIGVVIFGDQ